MERIRIFSAATPESNADPECYGAAATAYTASLIPVGIIVRLETGRTERGRYDRLLRHVWLGQGEGRHRLLQDAIVRDGYGVVVTYHPDVKYVAWLLQWQQDAVDTGREF